jgi:L-amino acid N-acyltransferase YncA
MDFIIDKMRTGDWEQVSSIYAQGIFSGNATFETGAPSWEQWDAAHLPEARLLARSGGKVLGWAALSPVSSRKVYAGVAEVSIYIRESARGRHVGSALLEALIARSEEIGVWTLQASIFPENQASLALHQKFGFRIVGRRERIAQMNGVWRDTILIERRS